MQYGKPRPNKTEVFLFSWDTWPSKWKNCSIFAFGYHDKKDRMIFMTIEGLFQYIFLHFSTNLCLRSVALSVNCVIWLIRVLDSCKSQGARFSRISMGIWRPCQTHYIRLAIPIESLFCTDITYKQSLHFFWEVFGNQDHWNSNLQQSIINFISKQH